MIKLKKINPQTCEVFNEKAEHLGTANELELLNLRIQIAENKIDGYFVVFHFFDDRKSVTIPIDKNGKMMKNVEGCFDEHLILSSKLFVAQKTSCLK